MFEFSGVLLTAAVVAFLPRREIFLPRIHYIQPCTNPVGQSFFSGAIDRSPRSLTDFSGHAECYSHRLNDVHKI